MPLSKYKFVFDLLFTSLPWILASLSFLFRRISIKVPHATFRISLHFLTCQCPLPQGEEPSFPFSQHISLPYSMKSDEIVIHYDRHSIEEQFSNTGMDIEYVDRFCERFLHILVKYFFQMAYITIQSVKFHFFAVKSNQSCVFLSVYQCIWTK